MFHASKVYYYDLFRFGLEITSKKKYRIHIIQSRKANNYNPAGHKEIGGNLKKKYDLWKIGCYPVFYCCHYSSSKAMLENSTFLQSSTTRAFVTPRSNLENLALTWRYLATTLAFIFLLTSIKLLDDITN
ncbi:hypothetical protein BD408DRAFT_80799 [Parasitella parasitica]|nr:hypothetical protein BD408DRAFT_80799 [Parasitella parasitica]